MRRLALAAAAAAVLFLSLGSAHAAEARPFASLDRVFGDRPDEALGPQVHLVYAVPSGSQDGSLDTNGTIAAWIATFNDWFAASTGGVRLRVDTFAGQPDVSFLRLPETDTALTAQGAFANDMIYTELRVAGFSDPTKTYAVIEQGGNNGACGWGGGGRSLGVMYLQAAPSGSGSCAGIAWPFVIGHEVFHVLGAVNPCATHYADGHVGDISADLMYAYAFPGTPLLDPGHDDYYGPPGDDHLPAGCPSTANVANSLFLTSHPFVRLSVAIRGSGAVSFPGFFVCTPELPAGCAPVLESGTQLDLVGVPDHGSRFVGWSGGGCSGTGDCNGMLSADTTVTATFAANPTARVAIRGKGHVDVRGAGSCAKALCSLQLAYDRATTIRAVAAKHWHFVGWAGACKGKSLSCTVKATQGITVRAAFARS
jgi:hypothetical protein